MRASRNNHYLWDISAAVPDRLELLKEECRNDYTWESHISARHLYSSASHGYKLLNRDDPVRVKTGEGAYDGMWAELVHLEFVVFARDAVGLEHTIWEEKKSQQLGSGCIDMEEMYEALEADGASQ